MVRRSQHRVAPAAREVDLRAQPLDLHRVDQDGLDTAGIVQLHARAFGAHPCLRVRHPDQTLGGVHDPAAGLVLEVPIELHAVVVEADRFRDAVVGADDGGVAPGVPGPDVVGLDDGHVGDAVPRRQVVRRGQAMAASTDDHHVVAGLRLVPRQFEQRLDELVHQRRSASSWARPADTINNTLSRVMTIFAGTPAINPWPSWPAAGSGHSM